ncbi:MAG: DEAD/DEAH box helicase family protein, partial [Candidatus Freyarchaeota archaeon]|nr:DEAD/DEAH box helicase family protein [Candidatus Jordarchaeia archaeon]
MSLVLDDLGAGWLRVRDDVDVLTARVDLERGGTVFNVRDLVNVANRFGINFEELRGVGSVRSFVDSVLRYRELKRRRDLDGLGVSCVRTALFDDQVPGVRMFLSRQYVGNWDEMGSGKTFMALYTYAFLKEKGLVKNALVICPSLVKAVWRDEVKKHLNGIRVHVCGNGTEVVLRDLRRYSGEDFCVLHYDALLNDKVFGLLCREKNRFDVVIIDEGHYIKHFSAQRTKRVLEFLRNYVQRVSETDLSSVGMWVLDMKKPIVWILTGTPVSERPSDALILLRILDPFFWRVTKAQFESHFCIFKELVLRDGRRIKKLVGFKNCGDLGSYFERVSIRRRKSEMVGMPDLLVQDRVVEMEDDQREVYMNIRKGVIDRIRVL